MDIFSKKLVRNKNFEKKIMIACNFNNAKCEFKQGKILNVDKTNVSFIELHRVNVKYKDKKLLLLYFDKNNMFLYNRSMQINLEQLYMILKELKEC